MKSEASYLKVVRDVYAEAATQARPKLCCTTSSLGRLPGLVVPESMQQMNYGCGVTVHPGDLRPTDAILYVGVGGGMEALQLAYFARRLGRVHREPRLRAPCPADLDLSAAPLLVRELAARGLWLEQERIVVGPRVCEALEFALHCNEST